MNSVEQELIATAPPYQEVEAAIVRRFFARKPSREDHIFWLKAQLWKDLHPVDGYFTGLQCFQINRRLDHVSRDLNSCPVFLAGKSRRSDIGFPSWEYRSTRRKCGGCPRAGGS